MYYLISKFSEIIVEFNSKQYYIQLDDAEEFDNSKLSLSMIINSI